MSYVHYEVLIELLKKGTISYEDYTESIKENLGIIKDRLVKLDKLEKVYARLGR